MKKSASSGWKDAEEMEMSINKADKVVLGITIAIAAASAGAVRLWMAFPTLVVGVIAAVALVRILNAQQHRSAGRESGAGIHPFGAFGPYKDGDVNPVTGMPMRGMYDAGGNRWMRNRHHDSE